MPQSSPALIDNMFKSNLRITTPPSCRLNPAALTQLYQKLNDSAKEAAEFQILQLQKGAMSDEELQNLKVSIRDSYRVHIEIMGSNGEYFAASQVSALDESQLPAAIDQIIFDSSFLFRSTFKFDPMSRIRLVLDFRRPVLFDFISNPSSPTRNDSTFEIIGQSSSWVTGAYENVLRFLRQSSLKRSWLHRRSVYDLLLWLGVIPLAFWNLSKLLATCPTLGQSLSGPIGVVAYVYFFVLVLYLFRGFFNYTRWLFPYLELERPITSASTKQRIVYVTLTLGLVYSLLQDLVRTILRALFT